MTKITITSRSTGQEITSPIVVRILLTVCDGCPFTNLCDTGICDNVTNLADVIGVKLHIEGETT